MLGIHIIVFENKFQVIYRVIVINFTWSVIRVIPLQHPQISRDFGSFSNFLEKLETSFDTIIENMYSMFGLFFQFFQGGSQVILN